MINADDNGLLRTDGRTTVLRDFLATPIFGSRCRRTDLYRFVGAVGHKKLQRLQPAFRCLRAGIVNPNVSAIVQIYSSYRLPLYGGVVLSLEY